ncbi:MAG: hypothetical protein HMLKMBBP_00718 [Planctomycetes bacterium]|nr:hypothetical protein [Planctomycetota bacterium]
MELYFCAQCGISIPLAQVTSGVALGPGGRHLCSDHRPAKAPAEKSAAEKPGEKPVERPGGAASPSDEPQLLFCANCQISIPLDDERAGRAKREFGSLLCAPCSNADATERGRRKRTVEDALRLEDTPSSPTPGVSPSRSASGIVAPAGVGVPAPQASPAGNGVLVALLVLAVGATGFFGAEYVRNRRGVAGPTVAQLEDVRRQLGARVESLETELKRRTEELRGAQDTAAEAVRQKVEVEIANRKADLAETRSDFAGTDARFEKSITRIEGDLARMREDMERLAARAAEIRTEGPRPSDAPPGPGPGPVPPANGGAAGPSPEGPPTPPPGGPTTPAPVNPQVAKLVKDLLEDKDAGNRFNAAVELGRILDRASIPALARACLTDEHLMVRRSCARGLGVLKAWNAVPVLIQALEDREAYVAQMANSALQLITQQDFGVTQETSPKDRRTKAQAVARWWAKAKDAPPEGVCLDPVPDIAPPK